jgi:hypothetical protein
MDRRNILSGVAVFAVDLRLMQATEKRAEPKQIADLCLFRALDYLMGVDLYISY